MPEVTQNEAVERLIRIAFNKENPSDLLMQLVKVLGKAGLKDEASRVKSMSKDLQQAWSNRDKAASMLREALSPQPESPAARLARITQEVRTIQASLDKRAMSMGKEIFQALVDIKKMYAARKMADEQTAALLRDIMGKLMEELEPRNRGVQRAINRLNNAISRPTTPENLRNQVFKVADELGMRLPSGNF